MSLFSLSARDNFTLIKKVNFGRGYLEIHNKLPPKRAGDGSYALLVAIEQGGEESTFKRVIRRVLKQRH